MDYLFYIALFVFGLIIGSFLNVVILRFNTGMSVARGRSACFSCGKTLVWYELVPFFSFISQLGSCRGCKSKISWQYPAVELAGGAVFVSAYIHSAGSLWVFILTATLLCLYIVIWVYDMRHKIIPDVFSYTAGILALGLITVEYFMTGYVDMFRLVAGPALFIFFWFFWFVSRGTWMGLGDGKLALSIGWALGYSQGISALLLSFWIGAIVSLGIMAFQKIRHKIKHGGRAEGFAEGLGMKSQIPFGPFLLVGFVIAFFWKLDIQTIFSYLAL